MNFIHQPNAFDGGLFPSIHSVIVLLSYHLIDKFSDYALIISLTSLYFFNMNIQINNDKLQHSVIVLIISLN